jgi:hypothetical protein
MKDAAMWMAAGVFVTVVGYFVFIGAKNFGGWLLPKMKSLVSSDAKKVDAWWKASLSQVQSDVSQIKDHVSAIKSKVGA